MQTETAPVIEDETERIISDLKEWVDESKGDTRSSGPGVDWKKNTPRKWPFNTGEKRPENSKDITLDSDALRYGEGPALFSGNRYETAENNGASPAQTALEALRMKREEALSRSQSDNIAQEAISSLEEEAGVSLTPKQKENFTRSFAERWTQVGSKRVPIIGSTLSEIVATIRLPNPKDIIKGIAARPGEFATGFAVSLATKAAFRIALNAAGVGTLAGFAGGAAIAGGREYFKQRKEVTKNDIGLMHASVISENSDYSLLQWKSKLKREQRIVQRVDKRKITMAALKGGAVGVLGGELTTVIGEAAHITGLDQFVSEHLLNPLGSHIDQGYKSIFNPSHPTETSTPTITATSTPYPTETPTNVSGAGIVVDNTHTPTFTETSTATPTHIAVNTETSTPTPTLHPTETPTPTATTTATIPATHTPTLTPTPEHLTPTATTTPNVSNPINIGESLNHQPGGLYQPDHLTSTVSVPTSPDGIQHIGSGVGVDHNIGHSASVVPTSPDGIQHIGSGVGVDHNVAHSASTVTVDNHVAAATTATEIPQPLHEVTTPSGHVISGSAIDNNLTFDGQHWAIVENGMKNITALDPTGSIDHQLLAQKLQEAIILQSQGQLTESAHPDLFKLFHLSNGTASVYSDLVNHNSDTIQALANLGVVK